MIRPAQPADFAQVFPIINQIFEDMDLDVIKNLPEGQFYQLLAKGWQQPEYHYSYARTVVEEQDGQIRGILNSYSWQDEPVIDQAITKFYQEFNLPDDLEFFPDVETRQDEWYLDSLAVAPQFQGQGVGGSLLDFAPQIARDHGHKKISLNVDQANPNAQRLYERKGFVKTEELMIGKHHYNHLVKDL